MLAKRELGASSRVPDASSKNTWLTFSQFLSAVGMYRCVRQGSRQDMADKTRKSFIPGGGRRGKKANWTRKLQPASSSSRPSGHASAALCEEPHLNSSSPTPLASYCQLLNCCPTCEWFNSPATMGPSVARVSAPRTIPAVPCSMSPNRQPT